MNGRWFNSCQWRWEVGPLGRSKLYHLENRLVSLDEENALAKYADYFNLTQEDLDGNGAQTSLVQAAVIRGLPHGQHHLR